MDETMTPNEMREALDVSPEEGDPRRAQITLKAVTTPGIEQGTFEAVISTASIDRERDVVVPDAMVKALRAWVDVGKLVPLAWAHSAAAEDQIGHIKPDSVKAVDSEVVAEGWIDQTIERGEHAWRLVKSGTLGFSFGYLINESVERADGVREIRALDVFEVSATATPMNHETRVLAWKSAQELREEAKRVEREVEETRIPDVPEQPEAPERDVEKELQEVKAQLAELQKGFEDLRKQADETAKAVHPPQQEADGMPRGMDPLRRQAETVALEVASGGESLRKSPKPVEPEPPELMPLDELKRRMRDEMLSVLSGGTTDEQV